MAGQVGTKPEDEDGAVKDSLAPGVDMERLEGEQYPKGIKLATIMLSLMLGTTLMALDATIISVATPKISTQFHSLGDVGWYGAAYSMILTATTPIASNVYKHFNPKYVYLASIVIFEGT